MLTEGHFSWWCVLPISEKILVHIFEIRIVSSTKSATNVIIADSDIPTQKQRKEDTCRLSEMELVCLDQLPNHEKIEEGVYVHRERVPEREDEGERGKGRHCNVIFFLSLLLIVPGSSKHVCPTHCKDIKTISFAARKEHEVYFWSMFKERTIYTVSDVVDM